MADRSLAAALYLPPSLGRPLTLEGEAGVGKTEIGKVLANTHGRKFLRLQCYEGLDVAETIDRAEAKIQLDQTDLHAGAVENTLGVLLKYQDDIARIQGSEANRILERLKAGMATTGAAE